MGINDLEKLMFEHPKSCNQCGGVLEYRGIGRYRCVDCGNEMLDDYGKLKNYFETHGPTPVLQLEKETGISRDKLKIMLKRGTAELKASPFPKGAFPNIRSDFGNYTRNK